LALAALGWQFTSAARWDCCCITSDVAAGSSDALTEAALHFGRQKRAKQSLLLVQRYKKFKEQETRAEAERQLASLEQTPPQEREQLVRDLHDELRAMARGATTIAIVLLLGGSVLAACNSTRTAGAGSRILHACTALLLLLLLLLTDQIGRAACSSGSSMLNMALLGCTCNSLANSKRAGSAMQPLRQATSYALQ
jgi:hypothetical protein